MIRTLAAGAIILLAVTAAFGADASPAEFKPYTEQIPKFGVNVEMIPIHGGRFLMAAIEKDGQPRAVDVKDFWMARCEIPWEAFDVYAHSKDLNRDEIDADARHPSHLRARPSRTFDNPDKGHGRIGYAVCSANFRSAAGFAEWFTKRTGRTYRLPTEAEFEYAARAGRPGQPEVDELLRTARVKENAGEDNDQDWARPHPIGSLRPNPFGLHDMLGNVAEWTLPLDPGGAPVVRGGSFRTAAARLTYHSRQPYNPRWQERDPQDPKSPWWLSDADFVGFRLVRERHARPPGPGKTDKPEQR